MDHEGLLLFYKGYSMVSILNSRSLFWVSIPRSSMDMYVRESADRGRDNSQAEQSFLSGAPCLVIKHEKQRFKGTYEPRCTHTHIVLGQEVR